MKQKIFRISILLLAGITIMTACKKKKDNTKDQTNMVSEVIDNGAAEHDIVSMPWLDSNGDTLGTILSYSTWLKVRSQYKSMSEDTVWAVLRDSLQASHRGDTVRGAFNPPDTDEDIFVECGKLREIRNGYITIIDSVMYLADFESSFEFLYKIVYQVAIYDDGYTREIMPYHRPENIRNGDIKIIETDTISVPYSFTGGYIVLARRKLTHSITVNIGGQDYTLSSSCIEEKIVEIL
ncbi:MAG: hypothetical protein J5606_04410 [Bacteroidales bacterium]|nr:hypothetical protein [Bacteroidales bacterium]